MCVLVYLDECISFMIKTQKKLLLLYTQSYLNAGKEHKPIVCLR